MADNSFETDIQISAAERVIQQTASWRYMFSRTRRRTAAVSQLLEAAEARQQAGDLGNAANLNAAVFALAGTLPNRPQAVMQDKALVNMRELGWSALETNQLGLATNINEAAINRATHINSPRLDGLERQQEQIAAAVEAAVESPPSQPQTAPRAAAPESDFGKQVRSQVDTKFLPAMTNHPTQAAGIAAQFLGQLASHDPEPAVVLAQGGRVLDQVINTAKFLQATNPQAAFDMALAAQEMAKNHLPDGPERVKLRERAFETAGSIATSARENGDSGLGNRLQEAALAAAGSGYNAAVVRGITGIDNRNPDAALNAVRGIQPQATTPPPVVPPVSAASLAPEVTEVTPLAQPAATRSSLSDTGTRPMAAPQRAGVGSKIVSSVVAAATAVVVVAGAIGAVGYWGQKASLHVFNNQESSFLGFGDTTTRSERYSSLHTLEGVTNAGNAGFGRSGVPLPGHIGAPRVTVNADNPYAVAGARALGIEEGRAAAQREAQQAKPDHKAKIAAAKNAIAQFAKQHPKEFNQAATEMWQDVQQSVDTIHRVDPTAATPLRAMNKAGLHLEYRDLMVERRDLLANQAPTTQRAGAPKAAAGPGM